MKKLATLVFSSALLLSSNFLTAQPSYPPGGYPQSNPGGYPTSNSYAANQINWLRSYADAVALSQSTSRPIVILFTGTGWCPACMKLERQVITRPEFAQAVGQKFVFLKAEFPDYSEGSVMASPYKPLLDRYGVDAFPTIVVVNANGQQLFTVNYREGGPQMYAQELLQKLQQFQGSPAQGGQGSFGPSGSYPAGGSYGPPGSYGPGPRGF